MHAHTCITLILVNAHRNTSNHTGAARDYFIYILSQYATLPWKTVTKLNGDRSKKLAWKMIMIWRIQKYIVPRKRQKCKCIKKMTDTFDSTED